jgi:hypothetical protein
MAGRRSFTLRCASGSAGAPPRLPEELHPGIMQIAGNQRAICWLFNPLPPAVIRVVGHQRILADALEKWMAYFARRRISPCIRFPRARMARPETRVRDPFGIRLRLPDQRHASVPRTVWNPDWDKTMNLRARGALPSPSRLRTVLHAYSTYNSNQSLSSRTKVADHHPAGQDGCCDRL